MKKNLRGRGRGRRRKIQNISADLHWSVSY